MHYEALTDEGRKVFNFLGKFNGFILAGGTALALQIGHRISVDFDFFTTEDISPSLLDKVKRVFAEYAVAPLVNNKDELTFIVNGVKVTFLKYPFKQVYKSLKYEELELFNEKEIALTKAYSVGRRGAYKDYIDLYFLLKERLITLKEIVEKCEEKYAEAFNSRLFMEQLIYLDDIEEIDINFLKEGVSKENLLKFFETEVSGFKDQLK